MNKTEKVMNELNQWIFQYYEKGINKGAEQERESIIRNLADNLIEESKEQGIYLSFEAALKRAEELITKRNS